MHNIPDHKVSIYLKELDHALRLSQEVHERQPRLLGEELGLSYYHTHILPVVRMVPLPARPAAALHDVCEDGHGRTPAEWHLHLRSLECFQHDTLEAVKLLTRGEETYTYYILQLSTKLESDHPRFYVHMIANQVKLADLMSNLSHLPVENSLRKRYIPALAQVAEAVAYYEKKDRFNVR